ncbi:hypothetical protein HH308_03230 [Gordonia sp. TBRC 11910]|uniref:S-formylglutathione hydrolase FrmB n=1 Tax=Gordonia asplenii TaxID=2725283 RepID=A0A848KMA7_9ACTN|nr:hypothetical protein [Gordonia asplenii]
MLAFRTRRVYLLWLPVAIAGGVALYLLAHHILTTQGLASDPAPAALWWWVAAVGFCVVLAIVGFRGARWFTRTASVLAIIATVTCVGLVGNQWVGYYRTVQAAWGALTAGPLPDQIAAGDLPALRGKPTNTGRVVPITTPDDISGFPHRGEYIYLPPQWLSAPANQPPPKLPVIMMLPGEFNTPADWMRTGNAVQIVDAFAAAHAGHAPILVFPDVNGSFNNDTECVNGPRGNVADHLTKEVRPQVISQFGADPSPKAWGIVGWSMGGTCAIDLTVMHPEDFSAFTDIAGDLGPVSGTKAQTVARLFGGSTAAWTAFDPTSVMTRHGAYTGVVGWFADSDGKGEHRHFGGGHHPPGGQYHQGGDGTGGRDGGGMMPPGTELNAAKQLCTTAKTVHIDCTVHLSDGGHTWQFAETAFTESLGWMTGELSAPAAVPASVAK